MMCWMRVGVSRQRQLIILLKVGGWGFRILGMVPMPASWNSYIPCMTIMLAVLWTMLALVMLKALRRWSHLWLLGLLIESCRRKSTI